jgi:hypothetical protein
VYSIGFVIFIVIISVFFITNIFFRNVDYYKNSIVLSAFFVPIIFAFGAYFSVAAYKKFKGKLSFKEVFGRAFLPMFFGGFLSIFSIFSYINFADKNTKDLLNYQYVESFKTSLEKEYSKAKQIVKPESEEMQELEKKYTEGKLRISEKEKKNEDMFSFKYFLYIFAGYCAYFLILSVFFGSFFRTGSSNF